MIGLWHLTANKIPEIFGIRLTKLPRGKLNTTLQQIEHGHHVFRACWNNSFVKQYEKFSTFLRNEVCSNNLTDFRLKKGLDHLLAARKVFVAVTDRFRDCQAQWLNVHVDFPLLLRIVAPMQHARLRRRRVEADDHGAAAQARDDSRREFPDQRVRQREDHHLGFPQSFVLRSGGDAVLVEALDSGVVDFDIQDPAVGIPEIVGDAAAHLAAGAQQRDCRVHWLPPDAGLSFTLAARPGQFLRRRMAEAPLRRFRLSFQTASRDLFDTLRETASLPSQCVRRDA